MSIKDRLEDVYPDHELARYSQIDSSILSKCPECGEKELEQEHEYYPENDSYVECKACGAEFDFKYENAMWIKKRSESKGN
jgi:transcription elongation factor Elf1